MLILSLRACILNVYLILTAIYVVAFLSIMYVFTPFVFCIAAYSAASICPLLFPSTYDLSAFSSFFLCSKPINKMLAHEFYNYSFNAQYNLTFCLLGKWPL